GAGLAVTLLSRFVTIPMYIFNPRMVSFLTSNEHLSVFNWLPREFPSNPSTPRVSWRGNQTSALGMGLLIAFGAGMVSLIPFFYVFLTAREVALWVLAVFGVIMIVLGFISALISAMLWTVAFNTLMASLAFAQLHLRWHTPIRLMRFLEDARLRGVLRTSGYV